MTFRAVRILKEVDLILAEDTRTAKRLLRHFNISNRLLSYYSYNEVKRIPVVVEYLQSGQSLALISESGTPLISDPGQKIVVAAIKKGIKIVPVPGPSATLTALVASGLPADCFIFEGFLPRKKGRKKILEELSQHPETIIIYESSHRIQKTLEDIVKIFGNRYIVLARELTKKFEEFVRGYASDIIIYLNENKPKGEIVLLIAGSKYKVNLE